jgi:hypothetical protein
VPGTYIITPYIRRGKSRPRPLNTEQKKRTIPEIDEDRVHKDITFRAGARLEEKKCVGRAQQAYSVPRMDCEHMEGLLETQSDGSCQRDSTLAGSTAFTKAFWTPRLSGIYERKKKIGISHTNYGAVGLR